MVNKISKNKKVFVGMSGGVDSSVTAALLKERGFDVTGVFIKVWQPPFLECTWKDDRRDAMRVAAHLDIPFFTMDLEKEYKEEIVDYMVSEYKAGRTPNPDVMCNKKIKFGAFFNKAISMGADFVATGHYARVQTKDNKTKLLAGVDTNKDQSYFLWTLTQGELSRTLFPIGEYEKSKVREMAKKFGLITADKKDSQGLCFIGKLDMKDFLKEFIEEKKGDVLNEDGEVVGGHDGAYFYTLGQRHGFLVTKKGTSDSPYFIIDKNVDKNTITVSHKNIAQELSQAKKEFFLRDTNWITDRPQEGKKYQARVRYRQKLSECLLEFTDTKTKVIFETPQITDKGQSIVVYDKDECIGGGIID